MGLHTETNTQGRFLTVVAGKLREKVDEGTEGAVKRSGEVGYTIREMGVDLPWHHRFHYQGRTTRR